MDPKERKPRSKKAAPAGDEKPRATRSRSARQSTTQQMSDGAATDALSSASVPKGTDEHSQTDAGDNLGDSRRADDLNTSLQSRRGDELGEVF